MSNWTDKRVLITGAARGIGLATARFFALAGAELILCDRDAAELREAAAELKFTGARIHARVVDVAQAEAVAELAAWVEQDLGGLDVLINNAGIGHHGELAETSLEVWRRLIAVNLMGPIYHIDAFLPAMIRRRSGQIVNISSGQAFFRLPTWGAYAAIKAALAVMSEVLHFELKKHRIQVTTVYPFMVQTAFYDRIEAKTWTDKMSMRLLPYYADRPEKVGRRIFAAVCKAKAVETVHPLNDLAFYGQVLPLFSRLLARTSGYLLTSGREH